MGQASGDAIRAPWSYPTTHLISRFLAPGEIEALTTNVDLHHLADFFDVSSEHVTHGQSLLPLITGDKTSVREYALGGIYGNWIQINNGKYKYARGPVGDNFPFLTSAWSTMPVPSYPGPDYRCPINGLAWTPCLVEYSRHTATL